MHIISALRQIIIEHLQKNGVSESLTGRVVVELCKDPSHGHFATNAALVCAKSVGKNPREFASGIQAFLMDQSQFGIENVDIAGPGFINIRLEDKQLHEILTQINEKGARFGINEYAKGKSVNVEFVSANPTGPLHIGHGRNAVFGDVVASLFAAVGYDVTREYYINDAGSQIKALAKSLYLRCKEAQGETIEEQAFDADMYHGDYLIPVAQKIINDFPNLLKDKAHDELLTELEEVGVNLMMQDVAADLSLLGINMNAYTSERELVKKGVVQDTIEALKKGGQAFYGVLEKPKGIEVDGWVEEEQLLFSTKEHGDDQDRVLIKSNGDNTYFAGDVGYHYHKIQRGYDLIVDILGFDHSGYLKRITAAVHGMKADQNFAIKVTQMVNFMDNGVPIKMSKRAGTFITINDLVKKVGKSVTRYMMVSRHQDMPIDFDFTKAVEESTENPLFYIYYANARIHSVLKNANELNIHPNSANVSSLTAPEELEMIKLMATWPQVIELAAHHMEPHRVSNYLHQLAAAFHGLWNMGKGNVSLRFIDEQNIELTSARLSLLSAISRVLEDGLNILGIETIRELR